MGEMRNTEKIFVGVLQKGDHLKDLDADGRIIMESK
jgi:hypothetical protein